MEVGYVSPNNPQKEAKANKSYNDIISDELENNIGKL
jgi:hypothetical protein